jgi:hypothetical protein
MVDDVAVKMPTAEIIPLFSPRSTELALPQESLRLIRAFLSITDPAARLAVIEHVERVAEVGA